MDPRGTSWDPGDLAGEQGGLSSGTAPVASGGRWSVATRQLRLTFVLVFLPLCASHLAVRCVSWPTRAMGSGALKYATKALHKKNGSVEILNCHGFANTLQALTCPSKHDSIAWHSFI